MRQIQSKRIFIIAGEASGDQLAALLVKQLSQKMPTMQFFGVGGTMMRQAGVDILIDSSQLAVVGAFEIITHLYQLYRLHQSIKAYLIKQPPDLIILVDYPGFNLRIAKLAKQLNLPVMYYVSPQIWAWHGKRIHKIKQVVDHMLVLFAFEMKIYQDHQVPVTFVGHPLVDQIESCLSQNHLHLTVSAQKNLKPETSLTIALLPGSRLQEIKRLLPEMIAASQLLKQKFPQAKFVLPLANTLDKCMIEHLCTPLIKIVDPPLKHILPQCDAAMVTSGTATLETALCQTPMVIVYKTNWVTYWLARWLIKIDKIGLSNIIAEKRVSKELIQQAAHAQAIADEITMILTDAAYRQHMVSDFIALRKKLGDTGTSERAANAVINFLQ